MKKLLGLAKFTGVAGALWYLYALVQQYFPGSAEYIQTFLSDVENFRPHVEPWIGNNWLLVVGTAGLLAWSKGVYRIHPIQYVYEKRQKNASPEWTATWKAGIWPLYLAWCGIVKLCLRYKKWAEIEAAYCERDDQNTNNLPPQTPTRSPQKK